MDRYNKSQIITKKGKKVHKLTKFPDIPLDITDIYVITQEGDRLDLLAQQFYNDSTLWFIISRANSNIKKNSIVLEPGVQLRIPGNIETIITNYKDINQ